MSEIKFLDNDGTVRDAEGAQDREWHAADEFFNKPDATFDDLVNSFRALVASKVATIARLEAENERLREALTAISLQGGNLGDDRLTDATGPNDARGRGLMYVACRNIALQALTINASTRNASVDSGQGVKGSDE